MYYNMLFNSGSRMILIIEYLVLLTSILYLIIKS